MCVLVVFPVLAREDDRATRAADSIVRICLNHESRSEHPHVVVRGQSIVLAGNKEIESSDAKTVLAELARAFRANKTFAYRKCIKGYASEIKSLLDRLHSNKVTSAERGGPGQKSPPIIDSGYDTFFALGSERLGFGLYTYVLLTPTNPDRTAAFIDRIVRSTPESRVFGDDISRINIIYLPSNRDGSGYNYDLSRQIMIRICEMTALELETICEGGLSVGPYLFTYSSPIRDVENLVPPLLFVDLSDVHKDAFSTFIDAYKQQIKRDDITDRRKIDALSLKVLNITMTAKDWVSPVEHAIGDIVHLISRDDGNGKAE
jgi:hypothetical protein